MRKYVINEISTDGYERFAVIQNSSKWTRCKIKCTFS